MYTSDLVTIPTLTLQYIKTATWRADAHRFKCFVDETLAVFVMKQKNNMNTQEERLTYLNVLPAPGKHF